MAELGGSDGTRNKEGECANAPVSKGGRAAIGDGSCGVGNEEDNHDVDDHHIK